jgi:hypothetical protein
VFEEFGVLRLEFGFWGFWSSEFVFVLFCLNLFTNFCFYLGSIVTFRFRFLIHFERSIPAVIGKSGEARLNYWPVKARTASFFISARSFSKTGLTTLF